MLLSWTENELGEALNQTILTKISASKLEFNSADIFEGDIFIALTGGVRDGHDFIPDALARGAGAIISQKAASSFKDSRVICVEDTSIALRKMAEYKRSRSQRIIGVTGSTGKTSTKDAIHLLLSTFGVSYVNRGTFNNFIGVPLSLASIPLEAEFACLEMGMNNKGEISELGKLARPHYAIITNIGSAHLENLGSIENICRAKCEIFENMEGPKIAILNMDSPYFDLQKEIAASYGVKIYTFGMNIKADCRLEDFDKRNVGASVKYRLMGTPIETVSNLYGIHQSLNLCAPLLLIHLLGFDAHKAASLIPKISSSAGRGNISTVTLGDRKITIIDDSYNANPDSVKASLRALSEFNGKKIAVLADMKELGPDSPSIHANLEESVINSDLSFIYCFGTMMRYLHRQLISKTNSAYFNDVSQSAFEIITSHLKEEDCTILIKGSKSTNISQLVGYIKAITS
ncbi:MAG: UDP-N-acetylmuramoyl-tripeptide--D-alanyl-D-alanine ligase [Alphaproteobacteria bacterium]|nr:UDP-N-acetylmuramoyl-tripeptide--D-alanyl-D-alanine ligase [Alphaproteobacteria bacterium]